MYVGAASWGIGSPSYKKYWIRPWQQTLLMTGRINPFVVLSPRRSSFSEPVSVRRDSPTFHRTGNRMVSHDVIITVLEHRIATDDRQPVDVFLLKVPSSSLKYLGSGQYHAQRQIPPLDPEANTHPPTRQTTPHSEITIGEGGTYPTGIHSCFADVLL